ncbi:hypothetical protein SJI00_03035 [Pseudomonas sp. RP23018S]|uniref:hypothetical protein n=1 Tax=Pseudomonas sp. RP23018S TaxID=3096037 RepID=UPI002ACA5682|nr:hypothetical protein [Pseudomonas sp. RP23018S]MDZ5601754.1 hypothetical protein [Pseudomonas sp. RP23018S]
MHFLLIRRLERGIAIPAGQLQKLQPMRADVHIVDCHSTALNRVSTQAWLFNPTPGPDLIPRLHDARIRNMAQLGLSISGVEEVDGALYAQSWWCRVCS